MFTPEEEKLMQAVNHEIEATCSRMSRTLGERIKAQMEHIRESERFLHLNGTAVTDETIEKALELSRRTGRKTKLVGMRSR